jgi:hypothetical protein
MNDIPADEGDDTSLPDCVAQSGKSNSCNADGFIITGFTPARRKTGMYIWIAAFICLFFSPDQIERLIIILFMKHFIRAFQCFTL